MIKKSEITHGALFLIPLWNGLGYFYGKLLLGYQLKNPDVSRFSKFIRVYDYYTPNPIENFAPDFFKEKELFVDPFIVTSIPKLRGFNSWKFLRHDPVYEEDEFVHHYWQPGMLGEPDIPDDKEYGVIKYGNLSLRQESFPYYRIKHLPIHRLRNHEAISLYVTYDWLKRNGKADPFEYQEGLDVRKEIRYEVMEMATDYRLIPKELRGRVAPERE